MKRTTIHIGEEDREAIRIIKVRFGASTDSDAIRLAVRILAMAQELGLSPLPRETARLAEFQSERTTC